MVQDKNSKPTLWQVMKSVLGALFGVQSGAVRERDFQASSPWVFIAVGVVLVIGFVLLIVGVVTWVLHTTGR